MAKTNPKATQAGGNTPNVGVTSTARLIKRAEDVVIAFTGLVADVDKITEAVNQAKADQTLGLAEFEEQLQAKKLQLEADYEKLEKSLEDGYSIKKGEIELLENTLKEQRETLLRQHSRGVDELNYQHAKSMRDNKVKLLTELLKEFGKADISNLDYESLIKKAQANEQLAEEVIRKIEDNAKAPLLASHEKEMSELTMKADKEKSILEFQVKSQAETIKSLQAQVGRLETQVTGFQEMIPKALEATKANVNVSNGK